MVGKTVGKYRVLERIGRGGMGIVYKAVDEMLDRNVAIKVLNSDFGDADILKRFRAEAVTLARLNHPGIATIYELHRQGDELMMVIEFVAGETLHQLADRVGPLDPPQAAHLCMQVLDALSHAHRAGVIHRDLKPANLMVTETGAVKVMDFGIARVLGSEHFTLGGLMMGTPAYMAPEQVMGQPIDARADLYAVGVVFYRLLSGRLPFVADTAIAMAQKQISEQPTPLGEARPELPEWCTAIVDRALAKDPAQRFQSADDFRVALASAVVPQSIGELPTLATPMLGTVPPSTATSRARAALESDAIALPTPFAREQTSKTVVLGRSHLVALAALFVVLAAGIVVLAVFAFRGPSSPRSDASTVSSAEATQPTAEQTPTPEQPQEPQSAAPEPIVPPAPPVSPPPSSNPTESGTSNPAGNRQTVQTAKVLPTPTADSSSASSKPPLDPKPETPPVDPSSTPDATAGSAAAPDAAPAVAFPNVRMLITDGDRLRERRGVLRIGNEEVVIADATASRVLTPLSAVTGIQFSRSREPRWRDASGKEVVTRVDLGRLSFFRSDRNWLILTTAGEPVFLSVENPQIQPVIHALQTQTGLTVQRFQ